MRSGNTPSFALGVCVLMLGMSALAVQPAAHYHLVKKVPLGAAPGGGEYFDYITVDAAARRVYLSHGTEVKVVDADSGAVVGTFGGLKRCHGVLLVKDVGKGFITDGDGAKVLVFDIATWQDKDLGSIARKMDNIERRLELARGGPQTQKMQTEVVRRLDEIIKELENQKKGS